MNYYYYILIYFPNIAIGYGLFFIIRIKLNYLNILC